jgi:hypothetical protein
MLAENTGLTNLRVKIDERQVYTLYNALQKNTTLQFVDLLTAELNLQ